MLSVEKVLKMIVAHVQELECKLEELLKRERKRHELQKEKVSPLHLVKRDDSNWGVNVNRIESDSKSNQIGYPTLFPGGQNDLIFSSAARLAWLAGHHPTTTLSQSTQQYPEMAATRNVWRPW